MKKLIHTLLIVAVAFSCVPLQSCLNGNDSNTTTYSDCAITSVTLGTLKRTYHVTSSTGTDSSYVSTYSASSYKFTIDQYRREIYNVDSLPAGTDSTKILITIGTKNSGYVYLKSTIGDSLFYHSSTDSVDFTTNPRQICIISTDGTNTALYKVKINIHRELDKQMKWNVVQTSGIEGMTAFRNITEHNGKMYAKGQNGNSLSDLYSTDMKSGKSWQKVQASGSVVLSAKGNIVSLDGYLYDCSISNQLIRSTDGVNWESVGSSTGIEALFGQNAGKIYGCTTNRKLVSIDPQTGAITEEQLLNTNATIEPGHVSLCAATTGTTIITTLADGSNEVLYKPENTAEAQKWMIMSNSRDQNLPSKACSAAAYGKYLIACSDNKLYSSLDYGRSWQERYYLYLPSSFNSAGEDVVLTTDSNGSIWVLCTNGKLYSGKLNEIAWK